MPRIHPVRVLFLFFCLPAALAARGYEPGETLIYKIKWGVLTAGEARMEVRQETGPDGGPLHRFVSAARGTSFMDRFFPVRNEIVSLFDPVRRRTVYNSKQLQEGRYRRQYEVYFDHARHRAVWTQRELSGNDRGDAPWKQGAGAVEALPEQFQDMLSAIYFNRSFSKDSAEPGTSFMIPVFDDLKLSQLKMEILERRDIVQTINGVERRMPAFVVRPLIRTSGLFRSTGETMLWISADEARLILAVKAEVPRAGKVRLVLDRALGVSSLPP